jgi:tetratricopeptide (TPR) repeat protein
LVKITYEMTGALKADLQPIFTLEEKRENAKALEEYKKVVEKVKTSDKASPGLKRYVEFRIGILQAQLGEKEAETNLDAFLKANPNTWQTPQVARQLASLQIQSNSFDKATKTLETLVAIATLPKEQKVEAELSLLDVQFQSGKLSEVKNRVESLSKSIPPTDINAKKLPLYQIAATCKDGKLDDTVTRLQKAIEGSPDNAVKAAGFNLLGHCYLLNNNKREAMWQFLWVDTVYNTDIPERLKAIDQLTKLYEKDLANPERAQLFREKAARLR